MPNSPLQQINMPDGSTYQIQDFYGVCSTGPTIQTKTVSIPGFTSNNLVDGVRVTVFFNSYNRYVGTIKLNVSGTGAKDIDFDQSDSNTYESPWATGSSMSFIFRNNKWCPDNVRRASRYNYGVVAPGDTTDWQVGGLDLHDSRYATPGLVGAGMQMLTSRKYFTGFDSDYMAVAGGLSATTPQASSWVVGADHAETDIPVPSGNSMYDILEEHREHARMLKVTYGDHVWFSPVPIFTDVLRDGYGAINDTLDITVVFFLDAVRLIVPDGEQSAEVFEIELYVRDGGGIVTYPVLEYHLDTKGYLTLEDLPIWNGSIE